MMRAPIPPLPPAVRQPSPGRIVAHRSGIADRARRLVNADRAVEADFLRDLHKK